MTTLKGVATATVVAIAAAGIMLARTAATNPETASLLLLGVGMIGSAVLLRLQSPGASSNEGRSAQDHALGSQH